MIGVGLHRHSDNQIVLFAVDVPKNTNGPSQTGGCDTLRPASPALNESKKGGQAPYGTRLPSYRCFLPDLAGFTGISMHRTQPQQKVDQEVAAIK